MTEFDVDRLSFEPRDGNLLVRHDGQHFYTIDGVVAAQRDSERGGYRFLDEQDRPVNFFTDSLLRRVYRDVQAGPRRLQEFLDHLATLRDQA